MKMDTRFTQGMAEKAGEPSDELQRMMARRQDSARVSPLEPERAGASFFFEVKSGWEIRTLADDESVRKVYTTLGLEDAFHDQTVRTILIPRDSSVTKTAAMRVCGRHGQGKTVFFEVAAS